MSRLIISFVEIFMFFLFFLTQLLREVLNIAQQCLLNVRDPLQTFVISDNWREGDCVYRRVRKCYVSLGELYVSPGVTGFG